MMRFRLATTFAVLVGLGLAVRQGLVAPVQGASGEPALVSAGTGLPSEVVDGDTLVLADGRRVRLVGIQAPKLPLGRAGFREWPLAREAKAALEDLVGLAGVGLAGAGLPGQPKRLRLAYGGRRIDRHGRLLAHLFDATGRWIQGGLLARGMARVYSFADNRARITDMLAIERRARAAKRGIWAHPRYRVIAHLEAGRFLDSFQLVEGKVLRGAQVRGRGYLNFGEDWRQDFTIFISRRARKRFERAGLGPESYSGKRVRVRGWIKSYNGPMIEATHPEQIEVLER